MVTLAFAQAGSILAFKNPYKLDRRRGGLRRRLHEAAGVVRRDPQHEEPLLARARLRRRRLRDRAAGPCRSSPGPRLAGDPRERAARQVLGLRPYRVQADVVRARVVPRDGRRRRLPAAARRRDARGDDRELHADAARDGRDRRHRHALGRDDRRRPLHVRRTTGSATSSARTRSRRCRRCCARRCSSRSSSSACSSSSSSSSCRAGSRGIGRVRRPRTLQRSQEALSDEDRVGVAGRRARRCC